MRNQLPSYLIGLMMEQLLLMKDIMLICLNPTHTNDYLIIPKHYII